MAGRDVNIRKWDHYQVQAKTKILSLIHITMAVVLSCCDSTGRGFQCI